MNSSIDRNELEGHTSRAFDGALTTQHLQIIAMGGLTLLQVREAATAYTDWDDNLAAAVLQRESRVNRCSFDIEQAALTLIATRQPVAVDLRAILSMSKIVTELERAGDECRKIALTVLGREGRLGARPGPATASDVRHLARLAITLFRSAINVFDSMDADEAERVVMRDSELDSEYSSGLRRLLSRALEDPRQISSALESAFVLKSLERIGDHARNIARQVSVIAGRPRSNRRYEEAH